MKQIIFNGDIYMETQTVFFQSGDIYIYPCAFEHGRSIVAGGRKASQQGRMVTDDSGTSHFRPYAKAGGSRYTHLFRTQHGEVKETADSMIFTLRFPKRLGAELIERLHLEETNEHAEFFMAMCKRNDGVMAKEEKEGRV